MSQFSKINTTLFFKIDKSVSDPFENQSQPAINENKESHLGRVLGRREKDKAQLTEDEIMEDKIADWLFKAFTHESSHHLLFNEDLIQIALFCLECCEEISIDVKRKLARLISISTLIQERLLKEEIILGICHLLKHKDELEMLGHTVLAWSHMAMNYDFCISPLSTHVMDHLVPLIPIFKGKDLYVLLVTISKIMQGRDENRNVFFYTSKSKVLSQPQMNKRRHSLIWGTF